jgi:AcrR family transcriptional regulator
MQPTDASLKDQRRLDLLNAAGELLAQNPAASLAEIADYAKIGKATLHRYFAGRDDLMLALGQRAFELLHDANIRSDLEHGSATEALMRLLEAVVPLGDKLYFLLREAQDMPPELVEADRATREPVLALLRRGQASGEFRSDLSAEWIAHQLDYMLFATWQAVHDGALARKDAARLLATTLLGGIEGTKSQPVQRAHEGTR